MPLKASSMLSSLWTTLIEYETPRLVRIHNQKLGVVRRLIQASIITYVGFYALWMQRGYQEFCQVESSVTVKIKGTTKSHLHPDSPNDPSLYTRVWDVADYVVPPAENGAFFVATNVIITPNQVRGMCPEDHFDVKGVRCRPDLSQCYSPGFQPSDMRALLNYSDHRNMDNDGIEVEYHSDGDAEGQGDADSSRGSHEFTLGDDQLSLGAFNRCLPLEDGCPRGRRIFKAHGPLTGLCVASDRPRAAHGTFVCEVESWCPIEVDKPPLSQSGGALMENAKDYTVFVKNSIGFPYFGPHYIRSNLIGQGGRPCLYERGLGGDNNDDRNNGCQIFKLGDMVQMSGGNFTKMALKGGVVLLTITWNCNLDLDFMKRCLPSYSFRILDENGWNFRHAKYHEENRRSLYKMYGIKFLVTVEGRGGKFNLKNTILNIGSGLALLGVTTIVCDFLLMYIKEKWMIKQKKYDYIDSSALPRNCHNGAKVKWSIGRQTSRSLDLDCIRHLQTSSPCEETTNDEFHIERQPLSPACKRVLNLDLHTETTDVDPHRKANVTLQNGKCQNSPRSLRKFLAFQKNTCELKSRVAPEVNFTKHTLSSLTVEAFVQLDRENAKQDLEKDAADAVRGQMDHLSSSSGRLDQTSPATDQEQCLDAAALDAFSPTIHEKIAMIDE